MHKMLSLVAVLLMVAALITACAATPVVHETPPQLQQETVGAAPSPAHVWIPGHWKWNGTWVWILGHWRKAPFLGAVWVPGHWVERRGGWVWVDGRWRE
jgi:hypothetical protein